MEQVEGQPTTQDGSLQPIIASLPILADVSRADLLLFRFLDTDRALVVGQAQPRSILPLYAEPLLHREFSVRDWPAIFAPLTHRHNGIGPHAATLKGAPIVREVCPVRDASGHIIGALSIETNVLAYERHRRRSRVFQRAVRQLQRTALRGELRNVEHLSPFGEHDGIYFVDLQRRVQYVSGIATNFFRRLGYMEKLVGQRIASLAMADEALVEQALSTQLCLEQEHEEQGLIWIRKALPVRDRQDWAFSLRRFGLSGLVSTDSYPVGVLITIHDDTEARRQEQELQVKLALMQEVHHRVKNNLQTIASLLRLQSRRADSREVQAILQESTNRILSIAVVHEFLSQGGSTVINIKDVGRRIIAQMQESLIDPGKQIQIELQGPSIHLPARQATACALIMNELLQNAVEHGYQQRNEGKISLALVDEGETVYIHVQDDGEGLPSTFNLSESSSLGLRIVQSLVQDDLHGQFTLTSQGDGTRASVSFIKQVADGGHI